MEGVRKKDAYYGVITDEKFTDENLTDENLAKFFKTGEAYVNRIYKVIEGKIDPNFSPQTALDFGCGTGRIAIPLAKRCKSVVGIDISEDMLSEAESNAIKFGLENTSFRLSDDNLSKVDGMSFDLVNTYIVLQHMNVERGMKVIHRLVDLINPGGFGVIHMAYRDARVQSRQWVSKLRSRVPLVHNVLNVLDGKSFSTPLMQMNSYDLNAVMQIIQEAGVKESTIHFEDHGGIWSTAIFFKKP